MCYYGNANKNQTPAALDSNQDAVGVWTPTFRREFARYQHLASVPELLRAEIPDAPSDRKPVRLVLCGTPKGVNRIIDILHVLGFAQIVEGRPPLPSPISGEIMRILTRYFAE